MEEQLQDRVEWPAATTSVRLLPGYGRGRGVVANASNQNFCTE
jgi:hypothetical protein